MVHNVLCNFQIKFTKHLRPLRPISAHKVAGGDIRFSPRHPPSSLLCPLLYFFFSTARSLSFFFILFICSIFLLVRCTLGVFFLFVGKERQRRLFACLSVSKAVPAASRLAPRAATAPALAAVRACSEASALVRTCGSSFVSVAATTTLASNGLPMRRRGLAAHMSGGVPARHRSCGGGCGRLRGPACKAAAARSGFGQQHR
jgi:hypothetical protein